MAPVMNIMNRNIQDMSYRGDQLEDMELKCEKMCEESGSFS